MISNEHDDLVDEASDPLEDWEEFRGEDAEPVGVEEFKLLNLHEIPEDIRVWAYAKHRHWHKLTYKENALELAVEQAAAWAEKFVGEFADYQVANLPWLRKK